MDDLTMSLVLLVHAAAPGGLPHLDPVGCSVAGPTKTIRVHERFQQQRLMAISGLPVLRDPPRAQRQDLAG